MPIISKIGARSWKVRSVYTAIYVVLIIGAASMIYPMTLMLSGSIRSETDIRELRPYPRYWTDDRVLFQKYVESKYNVSTAALEMAWWQPAGSFRLIEPPRGQDPLLNEFLQWRQQIDMPLTWYALAHSGGGRMQPINDRLYREVAYERFDGDLTAYFLSSGVPAKNWNVVHPPDDGMGYSRRFRQGGQIEYQKFKASRPIADRVIFNLDGVFWWTYLVPTYGRDIADYNREHGTDHSSYHQVRLGRHAPCAPRARADWETFVRKELNLNFIRLDASAADAYRRMLAEKYGQAEQLNRRYREEYDSFSVVPFPTRCPDSAITQVDWDSFIRDRQACPLDAIEVYGPRQAFEEFLAKTREVALERVQPALLPIAAADLHDAMANTAALRWEFTTRNYRHVLDYILFHGRGIINTLIYCGLAIGTALIINPLAAYALSRYRPPSTYRILLFCMATMAFPAEVTMIPAFLLLKRFPLWPLIGAGAAFFLILWILSRWQSMRLRSETFRMTVALGISIIVGVWLVPAIMGRPTISLLNTFAALVLPGMANGFFIFLLKGFFDSLPRELYEAADIDGGGEWTKFWTITMSLSKPILAVIALNAFTGAYSAFMMALIIIPDPEMWTLMVWLFQLQVRSHQAVVYAAVVIAAIPTLLVFVFCQSIIIRGIIVPVEK